MTAEAGLGLGKEGEEGEGEAGGADAHCGEATACGSEAGRRAQAYTGLIKAGPPDAATARCALARGPRSLRRPKKLPIVNLSILPAPITRLVEGAFKELRLSAPFVAMGTDALALLRRALPAPSPHPAFNGATAPPSTDR